MLNIFSMSGVRKTAPTVIDSTKDLVSALDDAEPAVPSGYSEGDIMVAIGVTETGTGAWTVPAGFTKIVNDTAAPNLLVATKTATASEGSTYAFGHAESTKKLVFVLCINGASSVEIGDVDTVASGAVTAGEETVSQPFALGIAACIDSGSSTFTTPSGWTSESNESSTSPSGRIFKKSNEIGLSKALSISSTGSAGDQSAVKIIALPA